MNIAGPQFLEKKKAHQGILKSVLAPNTYCPTLLLKKDYLDNLLSTDNNTLDNAV